MLLNCDVGEDSWESLGQQGNQTSPFSKRSNQSVLKEISPDYSLEGRKLKLKLPYFVHWCKELTHWKRPWCWERLKTGGEGDDRRWNDWMTSLTQWTCVWVNSRSWWWTGRPGMLQSMGSQRVRHDWETELNWTGKIPWRREKLPTPVLWPREFHGLYNLWGHKESDTTERLSLSLCI